jgi:hypothetical protein
MKKVINIYIYLMSVFCWSLINAELKIHGICITSNQVVVSTRFACRDKMCFMDSEMSCRYRVSQMYVYDESKNRYINVNIVAIIIIIIIIIIKIHKVSYNNTLSQN